MSYRIFKAGKQFQFNSMASKKTTNENKQWHMEGVYGRINSIDIPYLEKNNMSIHHKIYEDTFNKIKRKISCAYHKKQLPSGLLECS